MAIIKRIFLVAIVLLILFAGTVFSLKNSEMVTIDLVFLSGTLQLSFVVVVAFVLGAVLGLAVGLASVFKVHASKKLLEHRLRALEKSDPGKAR